MTKMQELMVELAPQMGFITDVEIPRIMAIDRLQQVLVRCNNCRFVCAVQDLAHLEKCIEAGGDWVRDVAFLSSDFQAAMAEKESEDSHKAEANYRQEEGSCYMDDEEPSAAWLRD